MSTFSQSLNGPQVQKKRGNQSRARKTIQILLTAAIALTGILILTATFHLQHSDYVEYWSSGKLLVHHVDPYSPAGVLAFEKAQGRVESTPLIMLNPPWALFLVAPLGFAGIRVGLFLWTLAALGSVALFSKVFYANSDRGALAFVFAPVLACIASGQCSPFLLLGFSLFLYLHRSHPFLAGASLLLMAIKPHLFLVLWVILLADCIYRRRFLIIAGGLSALAAATAFAMCFDPHVWSHYFTMLRSYKIQQGFLPTASMLFRMLIDVRAFWLLFVPSAFAIFWGLWYYRRHRQAWDWRIHGMLLMLVTVFVSPYGFFSDEVVLLPSLAFALTFPQKRRHSAWILMAINTVALYLVLVQHSDLSSRDYIWTPLAWLLWFLYATGKFTWAGQNMPVLWHKAAANAQR